MKDALAARMTTLPGQLRRSLTWDRGKGLSQHVAFRVETDIPVYFADPHSPWQRGTNENTNGLLRQYFPKGTDLSRWNADDIEAVAATLNARPRKTLGWKTPAEAFNELLSVQQAVLLRPLEPSQYASVAFRDLLDAHRMHQSLAAPGQCWDNAVAESFWATLKEELVHLHAWPTRASASGDLRVDRGLSQPPETALDPRLPQPSRVRAPRERAGGSSGCGMINVSAESGEAHPLVGGGTGEPPPERGGVEHESVPVSTYVVEEDERVDCPDI